jgi:two-component system LytT family response regulator
MEAKLAERELKYFYQYIMKIKALIVDDEENSRVVLRNLLESFFPEIEIAGEAENVDTAFALIEKVKPQLVFLDIQMPKANGFTLLKKFDPLPFEVIFVTSFDKYAINAIKFSALDYLLKPVETPDLKDAVEKAVKRIAEKTNRNTQIVNLIHSVDGDSKNRKIAVHSGEKVKLLEEANIVYIEADHRYCKIITNANETFTTAKYLKDFEDYLGENNAFVRISQSLMINIRFIKEYSKGEPCVIEMQTGVSFEVPRRKKTEVLERLKN